MNAMYWIVSFPLLLVSAFLGLFWDVKAPKKKLRVAGGGRNRTKVKKPSPWSKDEL